MSPWTWICWVTNNCSGRLPSLSETMCYAAPPPLPGETQTPYAWPRFETGIQCIPILIFYPHKYAIYFDVFKLCTNSSLGKKLSILESKKVPSSFLTLWVTLDQSTSRYQFLDLIMFTWAMFCAGIYFLANCKCYLRFCHLARWGLCWKVFSCEPKDTCFHYLLKILH